MKYGILFILLSFVGGCQKYDISYIGQTQIVEQEVKFPEAKPENYNGSVITDNTAFHFSLENMDIESLDNIYFLWLRAFICGQSNSDTDLLSAVYFSDEIKFADQQPTSQTTRSFYGVFIPRLLKDMKENSKTQNKPVCAKLLYQAAWELKKTSNSVQLLNLE